jgi:uncharacterized protein HemX
MSVESSESPQPAPVKKGTGCGLLAWVVILVIGLAVAAVLIREAKIEQERQEAAKTQRLQVRSAQLSQVGKDVLKASELIQQGDVPRALDILQSQQTILASLASEATSAGDTADGEDIVAKRTALAGVVSAIKQKQEETRQFAEDQVGSLEKHFPGVSKKVEEAKPAETPATPAGSATPATPGQPGAEAPSATPATPAAPATPAPTPMPAPSASAPAAQPKAPGGP